MAGQVEVKPIQIYRLSYDAGADTPDLLIPFTRGRLISALTALTTSAVAANRLLALILIAKDNKLNLLAMPSPAIQTASQTDTYSFLPGIASYSGGADSLQQISLPSGGLVVQRFDVLHLDVLSIQAADQLAFTSFVFEVDQD